MFINKVEKLKDQDFTHLIHFVTITGTFISYISDLMFTID